MKRPGATKQTKRVAAMTDGPLPVLNIVSNFPIYRKYRNFRYIELSIFSIISNAFCPVLCRNRTKGFNVSRLSKSYRYDFFVYTGLSYGMELVHCNSWFGIIVSGPTRLSVSSCRIELDFRSSVFSYRIGLYSRSIPDMHHYRPRPSRQRL